MLTIIYSCFLVLSDLKITWKLGVRLDFWLIEFFSLTLEFVDVLPIYSLEERGSEVRVKKIQIDLMMLHVSVSEGLSQIFLRFGPSYRCVFVFKRSASTIPLDLIVF